VDPHVVGSAVVRIFNVDPAWSMSKEVNVNDLNLQGILFLNRRQQILDVVIVSDLGGEGGV